MLSTVMVFYLLSAKRTLSLINGIRNSRGVMVFVFTIALALLFTPHMYSLGVTLGYILLAVGFYPSSLLEGEKIFRMTLFGTITYNATKSGHSVI